jgi:hypothetical protein
MATSPYAEVEDLLLRAGDVGRAWTSSTRPSVADLDRFIDVVSFMLDAAFGARGVTVPVENPVVVEALRGPVAAMALLQAVRATPNIPRTFRDDLTAEVDAFWASITDGTWPGLAILTTADGGSAGLDAESWIDHSSGRPPRTQERGRWLADPETPWPSTYTISKGMSL